MENLNKAKADAILNKVFRYPEGTMKRRDWLQYWKDKEATVVAKMVPAIEYNRLKYNRLTGREQEAYEKRCNEKKQGYFLYITPEGSSYDITKTEYDHFLTLEKTYVPGFIGHKPATGTWEEAKEMNIAIASGDKNWIQPSLF